MMPKLNNGQFQVRIKAPDGTRLERSRRKLRHVLQVIDKTVNHHVSISSAYVGIIPSSYVYQQPVYFSIPEHMKPFCR